MTSTPSLDLEQLELFTVAVQLYSVPEGLGCYRCSLCRKLFFWALEDKHFYWIHNGRQYRTHDGCYRDALAAPELAGLDKL